MVTLSKPRCRKNFVGHSFATLVSSALTCRSKWYPSPSGCLNCTRRNTQHRLEPLSRLILFAEQPPAFTTVTEWRVSCPLHGAACAWPISLTIRALMALLYALNVNAQSAYFSRSPSNSASCFSKRVDDWELNWSTDCKCSASSEATANVTRAANIWSNT